MLADNEKIYKSMTRLDLQEAYEVNYYLLSQWLKQIPNLNYKYKQIFNPKEVQLIFEHLGEPNLEDNN